MSKNSTIILATAVVIVIIAAGACTALLLKNDNSSTNKNESISDASEVAVSFVGKYGAGDLGTFGLAQDSSVNSAKAEYNNGSSGKYGSTTNYVKFTLEKDAKTSFDDYKTDFTAQVGQTVMGSTISAITANSGLTDGYGYYNNYTMAGKTSGYMYYAGYYENAVVYAYISLSGTALTDNMFSAFVAAVSYAIKNPLSGNASVEASAFVTAYGIGSLGTFSSATGNTCVSAKAEYSNGSSGKYGSTTNYVWFCVQQDAKGSFDDYKTDFAAQVGKTVMGSTTQAITEKGGFTDGYGYYNNYTMGGVTSGYMYYAAYCGDTVVSVYILTSGSALTSSQFTGLIESMFNSVKNA